jgi:cytochrome c553
MTASLTPALSQWARVTGSALRATFIIRAGLSQAGQPERPYLLHPMNDIRHGKRTNGLSNAMKAVASSVTDDQFEAIANWLSPQ